MIERRKETARRAKETPMNDRLEIEGDMREEVNAERERIEGYEACPIEPETDEDVEAYAADYADRYAEDYDVEDDFFYGY